MPSTASTSTSFAYIECDIPGEQTLVEWRRDLDAARQAERRVRRPLIFPRIWPTRWAT
jgi:hypothetical protein